MEPRKMKRLFVALTLAFASTVWAASPAPLTTVRAIHALSNAQAAQKLPVDFEATVTFFRPYLKALFVQDQDVAVFVFLTKDYKLEPGDRVRVRGIVQASFRPLVQSGDVTLLHHGAMPEPAPVRFEDLLHVQHDGQVVTLRALVRSADLIYYKNVRSIYLHMLADGKAIDATVESNDPAPLKDLLDAEVEVTGIVSGIFDDKMQETGLKIQANSMANIKVLKHAKIDPWTLPILDMDDSVNWRQMRDLRARLRVHGTITYYQPGAGIVLQDGPKSLWVGSQTTLPLQIGEVADATGFLDVHDGFLNLVDGEVQGSHVMAPVTPQPTTWQSLSSSNNIEFGHMYDLVTIEGQVVTETREAEQDEYVLSADGHLFDAVYRHSDRASMVPVPPMKEIPLGARLRVTGICIPHNSEALEGAVPFDILLRSFDDVTVVGRPSWLSVRHLMVLVALLFTIMLGVGARAWAIERRVRRQTAAMAARIADDAALERRRSRILEDINGSRPLDEILEEITEMVSFKLLCAPCWCQIVDGAQLGECPKDLRALRVVQEAIPSRSGVALGVLFAALDPKELHSEEELEVIGMGAALATLAIETRRLYTDLLHRSEFDQLTDVPNRFVLDQRLDSEIEKASAESRIFGLIYIDLDEFKRVNDLYGHHIGDLYLRDVARRMKHQLRSVDTLARIGGDEFAVLVPQIQSRVHVEEIVQRLENCFKDPFRLEEFTLAGSASIGMAIYPEDGTNKNSLSSTADSLMYWSKNAKRKKA
jgi:diguanylate cyclase (GGDEF)-like protein